MEANEEEEENKDEDDKGEAYWLELTSDPAFLRHLWYRLCVGCGVFELIVTM